MFMNEKNTYFAQLIAESEGISTSLWKHFNSLTKLQPSQWKAIMELEVNGVITSDSTEITDKFNNLIIQSVEELAENMNQ